MTTIDQVRKEIEKKVLSVEAGSQRRFITGNGNGTVIAPNSGKVYVRDDTSRGFTQAINFAVNPEFTDIPVWCKEMPDGELHVTQPDFHQLLNNGYTWETILAQIWLPTSLALKNGDTRLKAILIGASWYIMGGRLNFGTSYIPDTGLYEPVGATFPASGNDAIFYIGITNNDPPLVATGKGSDATTGTLTVADIDPFEALGADVMPLACTIISNGEVTFTGNQVYDLRGRYEPNGIPTTISTGYTVNTGRQEIVLSGLHIEGQLQIRGELRIRD